MTHIEDLLRRVNRLRDLLEDPHPGVVEWRLAFNAASESLLRFYDASQVPPASLFTQISEADAKNGYGPIPDGTRHSGYDPDKTRRLERELEEAARGNNRFEPWPLHIGYAICPECGSPDPNVHYVPHDTHGLCENFWHRRSTVEHANC